MKKNVDEKTAKLFEAARAAYVDNYSVGVIKSPIAKNVTAAEVGRFLAWRVEDNELYNRVQRIRGNEIEHGNLSPMEKSTLAECHRRRRAISNNMTKCGFQLFIQDDKKVIQLIESYQCGIMALPRIYAELCRLVGEKPIELAAWPINEAAATAEDAAPVNVSSESPAPVEDIPAAPAAAGYMSGETTRGRVHYVNNQDKAVSRVMDLERVNYPAPLPMWVMADGDYYYMVYQLADGLFFRPNSSGFTSLNMEAFRGDFSQFSEETISEALTNAAAIPAEHFNHKWPNMAVINAYKAAGMVKEADMLMAVREKIEQEHEEKKKAWKEKAEREEQERKQEEENRLNEAAAVMVNNGRITGRDIVALCDREGLTINPRTRHNLLEVVNYYEDNRICYKQYGKRKPGLDGCFNVARELLAALTAKLPTDAAEDAVPRYLPAPVELYQQIDNIIVAAAPAPQLPEPPAVVYVSEPYPPTPAATADTYTADEVAAMVAAAVAEERARHTRRRFAPQLWPVLRRLGRVAAMILPLLIVALFIGVGTASAPAADAAAVTTCQAAAETVAWVVELPAVTVTASRLTTTPAAPSPVKKLAAPSPVKKAAADAVTLSSQKTVSDMATATAPAASDADSLTTAPAAAANGLTICAGTPWAYTMMNWA